MKTDETMRELAVLTKQIAALRKQADRIVAAHDRAIEKAAGEHESERWSWNWEDALIRFDEDDGRYYCDDRGLAKRLIG